MQNLPKVNIITLDTHYVPDFGIERDVRVEK